MKLVTPEKQYQPTIILMEEENMFNENASNYRTNHIRFLFMFATLVIASLFFAGCGGGGGETGGGNTCPAGQHWNGTSCVPDVAIDSTPPVVSITAPTASATVSGTTVTVTVTASDASGIADVSLKVDGASYSTSPTGSGPYSFSWNTTGVSNGNHTLSACAHDKAPGANLGCSSNVSVTVNNTVPDTTPPTVSVTSPSNGTTVSGTVNLTATASDTQSGVAEVQFKVNDANQGSALTVTPYQLSWDTTKVVNGNYTVSAVAKDVAGNTGTSTTISLIVRNNTADITPPTVHIIDPIGGQVLFGNSQRLNAEVVDAESGVNKVEFYLNGTLACLATQIVSNNYLGYFNTTAFSDGQYTLTAIAYDKVGNHATSASLSVTVQNTFVLATPVLTGTVFTMNGIPEIHVLVSYPINDVISHFEVSDEPGFLKCTNHTGCDDRIGAAGYPTSSYVMVSSTAVNIWAYFRAKNCLRSNPTVCTGYSNVIKYKYGVIY